MEVTTYFFSEKPLPSFTWDVSEEVDNLPIVKLKVEFNDGGLPDMAQLTRIKNDDMTPAEEEAHNECILSGYLMDEDDVDVTVSGCPGSDTYQVKISLVI